ncbi:MAG TPA: hypothetical protein VGC95_00605 [Chitinophagaceae bacterium]|jgi:hypothetical protein
MNKPAIAPLQRNKHPFICGKRVPFKTRFITVGAGLVPARVVLKKYQSDVAKGGQGQALPLQTSRSVWILKWILNGKPPLLSKRETFAFTGSPTL